MLHPNKRFIGVNVVTERTEEDLVVTDVAVNDAIDYSDNIKVEEILASLEIEKLVQEDTVSSIKISSTINIDVKEGHKALIVKSLLNSDEEQCSSVRLRQGGGYTKHPDKITGIQSDLDFHDRILL